MTNKELLYVEDALGHETYFQSHCSKLAGELQDPKLKMCVQQMAEKHQKLFESFMELL